MTADDDEPEILGPDEESDTDADSSAVDRGALSRKVDEAKKREIESRSFWTQALAHPIGRRELWAVLESAHAFEVPFAASKLGFPDPNAAWFFSGQHSFGVQLYLSWLKLAPEGVALMLQENHPQLKAPPPARRKKRGDA